MCVCVFNDVREQRDENKERGKNIDNKRERRRQCDDRERVMVTPAVYHELLDFRHRDIQGTWQTTHVLLVWR